MGANLTPAVRNFSIDPNFVGDPHEVDDGCVTAGTHKVLRFDFVSKNVGDADFVVGRPIDRPDLFYFSAAHNQEAWILPCGCRTSASERGSNEISADL